MIYEYECKSCNKITDHVKSIEDRHNCPKCECGGETFKRVSKLALDSSVGFVPHYDVTLGQHFESESHKKSYLKSQGRTQTSGLNSPKNFTESKAQVPCSRREAYERFEKPKGVSKGRKHVTN